MSMVAYNNNADPTPAQPLVNNGFWPEVDPADFRLTQRLGEAITNARIMHALGAAMADLNRELADWQATQQDAGAATATDVKTPAWAVPDHYETLYKRAVYAYAHANLWERYRDFSATGEDQYRVDAREASADDLRRDARWAIHEIIGRSHSTVELI